VISAPLTFNGRLPGVVCQTALPPPAEEPLRLDVAAFVGFAERGPLDVPIPVEDLGQYRAVFGGDLRVARDGGRPVYAHLPAAVQAFFDNGGRRCYVVRVAGAGARATRFRLPGLVGYDGATGALTTVVAAAAWVGRWSEAVSVGTQLRGWPLRVTAYRAGRPGPPPLDAEVDLEVPTLAAVQPGDLLRLRFAGAAQPALLFPVTAVAQTGVPATTVSGIPITARAAAANMLAYAEAIESPPPWAVAVDRLGATGWEPLPGPVGLLDPVPDAPGSYGLDLPADIAIAGDDLLRVSCLGGTVVLFPVAGSSLGEPVGSPPGAALQRVVSDAPLQILPPPAIGGAPIEAERLRFDLIVREGSDTVESWADLQFGAGPGGWANALLPADATAPDPARSARLRAPLDGPAGYLPLGMLALPGAGEFAGPLPEGDPLASPPDQPPGKDGLDVFDAPALFLDPRLQAVGYGDLLNEADHLLYLSEPPQNLVKLHSVLPIDEVALVAVPDSVHRPWGPPEPLPADPTLPSEPPTVPCWARFQDCTPPTPPPAPAPRLPERAPCERPFGLGPAVAPVPPDIQQQLAALPVLTPPAAYDVAPLLQVQRALVTLAAARADVLALLSLPGHFGTRAALDWQQRLTDPLSGTDGVVLSYAAAYHPWGEVPEEATPTLAPLRAVPPDGAVGGLIAARTRARGAWIAPANVALRGIVDLAPALGASDWEQLFNARLNVLRQQPGVFTPLSAHTLSPNRLLLQVSVRRLLIFLRKLALRRGMQYVFESNDERFRQRVQASFERTLAALASRGALSAFEVSTGDDLNTPNDVDNGRFLIALKIAPTTPIEFITVVLLRSGEDLLQVLER
jgi:hypothetical protein